MKANSIFALVSIASCALFAACPSAGIHRSARILERGQSELTATSNMGLTSLSAASSSDESTSSQSLMVPGVVPVLSYHMGVSENVEVGGNVSPLTLSMAFDAKYRFFKTDDGKLHLALQPTVELQSLFITYGLGASLPLIATYEFNDMIAATVYGYGKVSHQRPLFELDDLVQTNLGGGLGAGVEIRGDSFFFMPFVEVSSTVSLYNSSTALSTRADVLQFGISVGYHGNLLRLIDKKVDRIEHKVDRVETRLDGMDSKLDKIIDAQQDGNTTSKETATGAETSASSSPSVVD